MTAVRERLRERVQWARDAFAGNPWRHRPGREPVDIGSLVSPLRYDVLVRAELFDLMEQRGLDEIERDPQRLIEAAKRHPYRVWFREVACAIRMPWLLEDPPAFERAFRERVERSVQLLRSYQQRGFDPKTPLTLCSGRQILATRTGKRVSGPLFAGDGCHRLALLLRDGVTELAPDWYRVRIYRTLSPRDSTAALLPALAIPRERYYAFLSLGYTEGPRRARAELVEEVRRQRPEKLPELLALLSIDEPALSDVSGVTETSGT